MRCNWDVQCLDRVPVLRRASEVRESREDRMRRWQREPQGMVPKEEGERRVDEVDVECKVKDNERTAGAVKEANAGSGDVEEDEAKQGELEQVCDARE